MLIIHEYIGLSHVTTEHCIPHTDCLSISENIENTYIVLPYNNEVGRIDNFRALARKLSFFPTELDIFDIRQHYIRILFIVQRLIF